MSLAWTRPSASGPLTTASQAAQAFRRLRWRLVRNTTRSLLAVSRLRLFMIVVCSALFWVGLFGLFFEGFRFLESYLKLTNEIVEYLFGLFFLSLLVMLVFSTGIILYTGLFHSRESAFLLTTPASSDRIFAHKFLEAIAFSSWGFLLLGSPMMVAYGIKVIAPGSFYALFLVYMVAFVLIAGGVGAVAAVVAANVVPRRPKAVLATALAVFGVIGLLWARQVLRTPGETLSQDWMDSLLERLSFSKNRLLPSRWMSAGLMAAARGDLENGLFYLMVTTAHAGLAYLVAAVVARDLYRQGFSRVQASQSSRRRWGWYALDALFHRALAFVPRPIRLLILKDLRTFRRDPAQWSQFLIFFGLLGFYFVNIRRLGYDVQLPYWRVLISFLNLAVTALILSTFTSRFIFPLLSLEGRNFWILGLLPLRRSEILWGKFVFATGISLVATEVLVVLSDLMLRMSTFLILIHLGMVAILCLGLSAISVGLGARFPNLKEEDPSKIATGFGGTLNLLVSLIFIALMVAVLAYPCHLYFARSEAAEWGGFGEMGGQALTSARFRNQLFLAMAASVVIGAVGTVVPLRIGIKAFQKMEF